MCCTNDENIINSPNKQQMDVKEPSFDFQALLQTIIAKISSYTEICLVSLTPQLIHFKVTWMLINKHKNYRIICTLKQSVDYLKSIKKAIHQFPIKKTYLSSTYLSAKNFQNQLSFWNELQSLMVQTLFDEIFIQKISWFDQKQINIIFGSVSAKKISFTHQFQFQTLNYLIEQIHINFPKKDVNLSAQICRIDDQLLLKFVSVWKRSMVNQSFQIQKLSQKQFGFLLPIQHKNMDICNQKREQVSIFYHDKQVLTVKNLRNFGCSIILKGQVSYELLINLINLISGINQSISLQIQALKNSTLLNFVTYVIENIQQSKYHISIGHQIELTTYRLVLNTTGLSLFEVKSIFQLMKEPGHYQFICYSSAEHFPAAVELFKIKPFVKFNFFLSLEEFQGQRQELIQKMQKHADQLRLKVYSYAGLLKNMRGAGYLAINSIFYTLGE